MLDINIRKTSIFTVATWEGYFLIHRNVHVGQYLSYKPNVGSTNSARQTSQVSMHHLQLLARPLMWGWRKTEKKHIKEYRYKISKMQLSSSLSTSPPSPPSMSPSLTYDVQVCELLSGLLKQIQNNICTCLHHHHHSPVMCRSASFWVGPWSRARHRPGHWPRHARAATFKSRYCCGF